MPRPLLPPFLAVLLAAGALAGCSSTDPDPAGARPVLTVPSQPAVASGVSQVGVPQLLNFDVTNGQVTGAGSVVALRLGTQVRLTVLADTTDVLLVSGYELRAQLTVANPVQLTFTVDRAGSFEVVLERTGTVVTRLEVS